MRSQSPDLIVGLETEPFAARSMSNPKSEIQMIKTYKGKKESRIHDCDKMVVEKTSGMGRISLHEKSLAG
jgi:hypothetical protein